MAESGCYRISYTPTYRGRHVLTLLVDKCQIPNSPFSVFVEILTSQLGDPVSIIYDVELISDMTVTSTDTTVVAEHIGAPIVFFKDEKKVHNVSRNSLKLDSYEIVGIDVDSEDLIYFTLGHSSMLVKLDRKGNLVRKVRSKQNTSNLGLAVVGEEVAVCPRHSNGTIMIYDRELKYLREIKGNNMGQFRDISSNSEGHLFVTDWSMNHIRVFSSCGSVLRSFNFLQGIDASSVKLRGICVYRQFVYVCVDGGTVLDNGVFVLTHDGDHMSTIGSGGRGKGQLVIPCGVHVDQDGYVHVADTTRLQVF